MKIENADGETVFGESVESALFFPPSSPRPAASALPNPAPATKRECGGGVGKMEGGKKRKEVVESNLEKEIKREKEQKGEEEIKEVFNGQKGRKLNDLDIRILGLLETWGALGLGQIEGVCGEEGQAAEKVAALFFNESFKYAGRFYLRLRGVERAGLVRTQRALNSKQVYRLTQWGHAALRRQMGAKLPSAPRSVSPTTLEHRIICAGAGLLISRFLGLPVLSERQFYYVLRANLGGKRPVGFHLPDLMVQLPEGRCPVEIELHLKTEESYRSLWSFYKDGLGQKDKLLYLTPSRHFTRRLLDLARSHQAGFLYACDLAAFRGGLGRAEFHNPDGDVFRF